MTKFRNYLLGEEFDGDKHFNDYLAKVGKDAKSVKFTITGSGDWCNSMYRLMHYLKDCGDVGHSVNAVFDKDSDGSFAFGFDGDGSDRIIEIDVQKIE